MKTWLAALAAAAAIVAFPLIASADSTGGTIHLGPFPTAGDPDGGSCGSFWATDTFDRFFQVQVNPDGTATVREEFKNGSFVTSGPVSPGACEGGDHHGQLVAPGITGTLTGYLVGTVQGGTFNAAGCLAPTADCTSTGGFIAATFGTGATLNVTDFGFEYASSDPSLVFHHWTDSSGPKGVETFIGDIATS